MAQPPYTAEEILRQLDACAEGCVFPMLDNGYVYPADVRLHAFRDDARWAIVIEALGQNPRAGHLDGISNCLHCYGNCLRRPPGTSNEDFLHVVEDGPDGPTFDEETGSVREGVKDVRIRGHVVPLALDPVTLAAKGIALEDGPGVRAFELLRGLLPEHRDWLLATEEELRERVPPDLPRLLRLDEWHHPDVVAGEEPGESPMFRMIASVLVTGDAALYRPLRRPNTHWSHWPQGGTL